MKKIIKSVYKASLLCIHFQSFCSDAHGYERYQAFHKNFQDKVKITDQRLKRLQDIKDQKHTQKQVSHQTNQIKKELVSFTAKDTKNLTEIKNPNRAQDQSNHFSNKKLMYFVLPDDIDTLIQEQLNAIDPTFTELRNFITFNNLNSKEEKIDPSSMIFRYKNPDIKRLINARRMQKVIEDSQLTQLAVPKKYIYLDKTRDWSIIAEEIFSDDKPLQLNLEETQQLVTLLEKTAFIDIANPHSKLNNMNIMRDAITKKLFIIDTENRSFSDKKINKEALIELPRRQFEKLLTIQSRTWVSTYHEELSRTKTDFVVPLYKNKSLDDPSINSKKIKQQFNALLSPKARKDLEYTINAKNNSCKSEDELTPQQKQLIENIIRRDGYLYDYDSESED